MDVQHDDVYFEQHSLKIQPFGYLIIVWVVDIGVVTKICEIDYIIKYLFKGSMSIVKTTWALGISYHMKFWLGQLKLSYASVVDDNCLKIFILGGISSPSDWLASEHTEDCKMISSPSNT